MSDRKERIAICPGSFDPVTNGHMDIIRRAAGIFDKVIVLVAENIDKQPLFTAAERVKIIREVCSELPNVKADTFHGLLVDYMREHECMAIVKGLRAVSDFEYEFQMALTNRKLFPLAETVFLTPNTNNMYLSSSMVRQVAAFGGDISSFVPEQVAQQVKQRIMQRSHCHEH